MLVSGRPAHRVKEPEHWRSLEQPPYTLRYMYRHRLSTAAGAYFAGSTRVRIAMISTPFVPVPPPRYGGTELIVAELVDGFLREGHEVTLFATGDSRTRAELKALHRAAEWPPDPT